MTASGVDDRVNPDKGGCDFCLSTIVRATVASDLSDAMRLKDGGEGLQCTVVTRLGKSVQRAWARGIG